MKHLNWSFALSFIIPSSRTARSFNQIRLQYKCKFWSIMISVLKGTFASFWMRWITPRVKKCFYPTALSPSTRVRGERKSKHGRAAYAWLTDDHSPKLNMQPFLLLLSHTELLIFNILCKTNEEVRCFFKMPSDFKNYDGSLVDCVFKSSHDNWVFKCRYVLCNKN